MAVESPPFALQAGSYGAEQTRRAIFAWAARTAANSPGIISGGLLSSADCQISAPVSGMSANVSTGEMMIPGNEGAAQGGGYARISSQTNVSIAAASPSNPRIDTICATMSDAGYTEPTGGSGSQWAVQVVTGTPTAGATLANLNGAATLPLSSLLLGYVLVPTSATNIITADIANKAGTLPTQLHAVPLVATPAAGFALTNGTPTIASWAAPSDGSLHSVVLALDVNVTSAETGGAISAQYTINGNVLTTMITSGGAGTGQANFSAVLVCDPGSIVSVQQSSALTAGAAKAFAALSGG